MAWANESAETTISFTTSNGTTEQFSAVKTTTPGELWAWHLAASCGTTANTYLFVSVYASLDGTNFDTVPFASFTFKCPAVTNTYRASFLVEGVYSYKIGVKNDVTGASWTINLSSRRDSVSL